MRDTYATEATSSVVADGEWYLYVRTVDAAGNWAADAAYAGPFRVDTAPPTNPTIDTSSPASIRPGAADNTIDVSWSGATDGSGGRAGLWPLLEQLAHGAARPDPAPDGDLHHQPAAGRRFSVVLPRALGGPGRQLGHGATHHGPFWIDRTPPAGCSISSPATAGASSFAVSWFYDDRRSGVASSGVAGYDVQVRDGAGSWTGWQSGVTSTSASYSGALNSHSYGFRVRARDHAGNVSGYDCQTETAVAIPPTITAFSPTAGFPGGGEDNPPLQLVPGSTIIITGTDFTGGTAYFNGVAMQPTLSQVESDTRMRR